MSKKLQIDVVSDYACPWCYVGKRRLEMALEQRTDIDADVRFLPFQLTTDMPREGIDRREHFQNIFSNHPAIADNPDMIEAMLNNARGIGKEENLVIQYIEGSKAPNTLSAHVVSHRALQQGKQSEFSEKLFEAYFSKGENIGDHDVLLRIAEEVGLDTEGLKEDLANGVDEAAVQQLMMQAQSVGVSGVPFFIINQKYGLSGAQPVEVLINAFEQALEIDQV